MDENARDDRMTVSIRDLQVSLSVGVNDWERVPGKTQLVSIDIDLYAPCPAAPPAGIGDCLDYSAVVRFVREDLARRGHTDLLETLAFDLTEYCLAHFAIDACRVRFAKPHVYDGTATPSVELLRRRSNDEAAK